MTEEKILKPDEIEALLKANGQGQDEQQNQQQQQEANEAETGSGQLDQASIDAMLSGGSTTPAPPGGEISQDEIDALLGGQDAAGDAPSPASGEMSQADIDAMLNGGQTAAGDAPSPASGEMSQADIDAMLNGGQTAASDAPSPASGELSQADIDAMLSGGQAAAGDAPSPASGELSQAEIDAMLGGGSQSAADNVAAAEMEKGGADESLTAQAAPRQPGGEIEDDLTVTERDALGEVGNISMGAAATTLSQLLNSRVDITSPKIKITTKQDFVESFKSPFLVIKVQFTDGFEGHNVLVIKLHDAKVMADLMMGGDGTNLSEDISEIEISAAAEAMNQMIGTSSTALADLMDKSINIAPPEVVVVQELGETEVNLPFDNPLVVISFDLIIKDLVDTSIMQVIDISNAKEQARALLGSFGLIDDFDEMTAAAAEQSVAPVDTPQPEVHPAAPVSEQVVADAPVQQQPVAQAPVQTVAQAAPAPAPALGGMAQVDAQKLDLLLDIPLKVSVVLGRTKKSIKEVLSMTPGAIAELETVVEEPVDILVNGKLVAKGEVVVVNENFGVKITSIISTTERIHSLGE